MTPEELAEQQRRLGIAISPVDRAARNAGAGASPESTPPAETLFARQAPLADAEPFAMPDVSTMRARAVDEYAGEAAGFVPAGYVLNPAATNFGRLSTPRTDVPRFVPADRVPRGLSPLQERALNGGIDVNSYVGSRYAPAMPGASAAGPAMPDSSAAQGMTSGTMLPVGNLQAKRALLRAEFPNANRAELTALGNLAYNRPDTFNTAVANTRLDPVALQQRVAQGNLTIAQTAQSMRLAAETGARQTAQFNQGELDRRATQTYFQNYGDTGLAEAAAGGADAGTLTTLNNQERARAQLEFEQERARDRDARFDDPLRPATIFGGQALINRATGNVILPPTQRQPPATQFTKLLRERAQAAAAGATPQELAGYDAMIANEQRPRVSNADLLMAMANRTGPGVGAQSTSGTPAPKPTPAAKPANQPQPQSNAPADKTTPSYPAPNANAITYLRNNPSLANEFDRKFGPGASKRILGQ